MLENDQRLAGIVPAQRFHVLDDLSEDVLVGFAEVELSTFVTGGGPLYTARQRCSHDLFDVQCTAYKLRETCGEEYFAKVCNFAVVIAIATNHMTRGARDRRA